MAKRHVVEKDHTYRYMTFKGETARKFIWLDERGKSYEIVNESKGKKVQVSIFID